MRNRLRRCEIQNLQESAKRFQLLQFRIPRDVLWLEEKQQEAEPKATSDQLKSQKTATPAPIRPPVVSPVFGVLGFGKKLEIRSRPPDPLVNRGQSRGEVIAVLTLVSTCQRMLTYSDRLAFREIW